MNDQVVALVEQFINKYGDKFVFQVDVHIRTLAQQIQEVVIGTIDEFVKVLKEDAFHQDAL
jgi:sulfur transfer complex TusBCD TusB component (DsrH family)